MTAVRLQLVGGPRDGEQIELDAGLIATKNAYLSAPNAPGTYWRAAGLGPLALTFLPAPGGMYLGPPEVVRPPAPEGLFLCQ